MNYDATIGLALEGLYKVSVVDAVTGEEVWQQPEWGKNLILNQGMDALAWYYPIDAVQYGIAGTGTRINNLSGGESSGSAIGGWFSLLPVGSGIQDLNTTTYGGWIGGILDEGDLIKFNDGTEITIGSSIGDLSASINTSTTISSQSFVIWKTSQNGLQTEQRRCYRTGITNASYYLGDSTSCYTRTSSFNHVHHLRTFDFASESALRNYTEVGVGWDADNSPSQSTFSRILLPAAVPVSASQRLRLKYQLNICYSPASESYMSNAPISGWPVAPATNTNLTQSLQLLGHTTNTNKFYSWIQASDGTSITSNATIDVPSSAYVCAFWLSTNSQSLIQLGAAFPSNRSLFGTFTTASSLLDDYVLGSYQRSKYATFNPTQINFTTLKSMGFGNNTTSYGIAASTGQVFTVLFEQTQSKYNTQSTTFRYLWRWNRVLAS